MEGCWGVYKNKPNLFVTCLNYLFFLLGLLAASKTLFKRYNDIYFWLGFGFANAINDY